MAEEKSVFRKKSIDRVNSPEALNDYIKVANPTVWISLVAIIVFLLGVCAWGAIGRLETCRDVVAVSKDGITVVYYNNETPVKQGMIVRVNDFEGKVISVPSTPIRIDSSVDSYAQYLGGFTIGDFVYEIKTDLILPAGVYSAKVVVDSVSPMSLIFN